MRKKIIAGNWKMNLNLAEGKSLVESVLNKLPKLSEQHQVVFAPTYLHIADTLQQTHNKTNVFVAAQNCHHENHGAFTGEISPLTLKNIGVQYVILGHSERRTYNNESNQLLSSKIDAALNNGLSVIFCCGEPLEIREKNTQNQYIETQISESLFHLEATKFENIVIAYEPIWAIGTGRTANASQAQEVHQHIRQVIANKYSQEVADIVTILYGGSCKPSNAAELFACPDVDGGLIGGAALISDDFLSLINTLQQA